MYIIVYTTNDDVLAKKAKKAGANVVKINDSQSALQNLERKDGNNGRSIIKLLHSLNIKPNIKGYRYYKYIFERCINEPGYHNLPVTVTIYPECAEKFDDTPSNVERALRHAILRGYRTSKEAYEEALNVKLDKPLTVAEFIAMAGEYLLENKI